MRYPEKLPQSVQIDGLVNTPQRYSLDDLAKVPPVKKTLTLECFVNTAGGPLIFNTPFEGAPLPALLQKAGVKPEAKSARIETIDGHPPFLLPLAELQRAETMLVGKFGGAAGADAERQSLYAAVHPRRRRQSSSQMGDAHHARRQ